MLGAGASVVLVEEWTRMAKSGENVEKLKPGKRSLRNGGIP
jgi:hypothetical protein